MRQVILYFTCTDMIRDMFTLSDPVTFFKKKNVYVCVST